MSTPNVGIWAIGTFLPPQVRTNDWWPSATVAKWQEALDVRKNARSEKAATELPAGSDLVLAAISEQRDDPFKGARERRVMSEGMMPSDMEIAAAREALDRAQLDPAEIDLLLVFSGVPDYLTVPNGPRIHSALGLRADCLTISMDNACNTFQTQLTLAEQMISGGRVRHALLVQSSAVMHLIPPEEQHSAWFGDGATAVVLGPVRAEHGVISTSHRTDGSFFGSLVGGGYKGGTWFDDADIALHFADRKGAVRLAFMLPLLGKTVLDDALGRAGLKPKDVNFYAAHQGTSWFRRVSQAFIGLSDARFFDTYDWTTSLSAANLPFVMAMAERQSVLREGDLVAMYSGGSGITVSGTLLRWGR
jgi:3-oxoacyl-[acyl-carrier-protein] synthase III